MSHKPAKPIQQQIQDLINVRKARLQKEIQEFERKKYDAEYVYRVNGGSANRCKKAIQIREDELEQLIRCAGKHDVQDDHVPVPLHMRQHHRDTPAGGPRLYRVPVLPWRYIEGDRGKEKPRDRSATKTKLLRKHGRMEESA